MYAAQRRQAFLKDIEFLIFQNRYNINAKYIEVKTA